MSLVALLGRLIRALFSASKGVVTEVSVIWKHWSPFAGFVDGLGPGVGVGHGSVCRVMNPLSAPMYWAARPNESASPTSSTVGLAPFTQPATARPDAMVTNNLSVPILILIPFVVMVMKQFCSNLRAPDALRHSNKT